MAALLRPAAVQGGILSLSSPCSGAPGWVAGIVPTLGSAPRRGRNKGKQLEGLQGQAGSGLAHPARSDAAKQKAVKGYPESSRETEVCDSSSPELPHLL